MSNQNEEHLRLLSIFHYVVGGIIALFGCFPIIHLIVGLIALFGGLGSEKGPPVIFGLLFVGVALFMISFCWILAGCMIAAGKNLSLKRKYTFCFVVACVSCVFMPFGTVLGVFTIILLSKPEVKELFE